MDQNVLQDKLSTQYNNKVWSKSESVNLAEKVDLFLKVLAHQILSLIRVCSLKILNSKKRIYINLKYVQKRNLPYITILGSCRQDSIYSIFKVSSIRNGLTYPHYANETLQLIKFLNGEIEQDDLSPLAFRNSQIGNKLTDSKKARREFAKTDIFLIEIASFYEYFHENKFIHHVAYDEPRLLPPDLFELTTQNPVTRRKQTACELIETLDSILERIDAKKVIFVSQISTRDQSTRSELNNVIKHYADQKKCGFFDPTEFLKFYRLDEIYILEPVISHLTDLGHSLVGSRLSSLILERHGRNIEKNLSIVQKYNSHHGLGDFIFGSITLFQEASKNYLVPKIDFSESAISKYLMNKHSVESKSIKFVFHGENKKIFRKPGVYFSNIRPNLPISPMDKDFLIENVLNPEEEFFKKLENKMRDNGLEKEKYLAFHIRMGDDHLVDGKINSKDLDHKVNSIKKIIFGLPSSQEYVVLSDSIYLISQLKDAGIRCLPSKPVHIGVSNTSDLDVEETLFDFFILFFATQIYRFSLYPWGSGFSEVPALLKGKKVIDLSVS